MLLLLLACTGKGPTDTGGTATTASTGSTTGTTTGGTATPTGTTASTGSTTGTTGTTTGGTGSTTCTPVAWYADADGDGYGDPATEAWDCAPPSGAALEGGDCDDGDPAVHPGAEEICNGVDDDCDPATPEDGLVSTGGVNHPSIQAAVDAAAPGDRVDICAGTWSEHLTLERDVHLLGVEGAETTVIDGGGKGGPTVEVVGGHAVLEGLTLTGGTGRLIDGFLWGGGLMAQLSDGVEVVACVIEGNTADIGGGMVGTTAWPARDRVADTVVRDNEAWVGGGGLLLFNADLERVEVTGNTGLVAGGATFWYWDVVADADTVIHGNTADMGGGVYIWDEGSFTGGVVEDNQARLGGGVISDDECALVGTVVRGNTAEDGGGLWLQDASATLDGIEVVDNYASGSGGGLYVDGGTADVLDALFSGNQASADGGCVAASQADLYLSGTVLDACFASGSGGGLAVQGGSLTVDGGEVSSCMASADGGGIRLSGRPAAALTGLALLANHASGQGGGLALAGGTCTMDGVQVDGNTADGDAGGAWLAVGTALDAVGAAFLGNVSAGGMAGGLRVDDADLTCDTCDLGAGATDNVPLDLRTSYLGSTATWSAGAGVTFSCTTAAGTCTGL